MTESNVGMRKRFSGSFQSLKTGMRFSVKALREFFNGSIRLPHTRKRTFKVALNDVVNFRCWPTPAGRKDRASRQASNVQDRPSVDVRLLKLNGRFLDDAPHQIPWR